MGVEEIAGVEDIVGMEDDKTVLNYKQTDRYRQTDRQINKHKILINLNNKKSIIDNNRKLL